MDNLCTDVWVDEYGFEHGPVPLNECARNFGRDRCEYDPDPAGEVWAWRERALRAAAVWPCTKARAYSSGFVLPDGPSCSLRFEHLHPAVQAAWTGRCLS